MVREERIEACIKNLKRNNFIVYRVKDACEAKKLFFNEIAPSITYTSVSWGDSRTFLSTGILDELRKDPKVCVINTFGEGMSREQKVYWRRQALMADLFFAGTNAVTVNGQLMNLDMVGNRVAGITFGPEQVVLFISTNKIVDSLEDAYNRIRTIAAPQNAALHSGLRTPCQKIGKCVDCCSPDRICNTWTIHEKCFPAGRIRIVFIDEVLGL